MKKMLTNNIGLKIVSLIFSVILWIVVVNVDDPIITRVYTGVNVEILNATSVTAKDQTYEIVDGNEPISVTVTANRSVIEKLTRNDIKATADFKNIVFEDTLPIELKTTIYTDKISSISSRTTYRTVKIEDKKDIQLKLSVEATGDVAQGHYAGSITPEVNVIKVSGPESKVSQISSAKIFVDYASMNETFTTSSTVILYDSEGEEISDQSITLSKPEVKVSVEVLGTKEITIVAEGYTGTPAGGYGATGEVVFDPSSITVAGKTAVLDGLTKIVIPKEAISVEGATGRTETSIDIKSYLPKDVIYVDSNNNNGIITLTAVVEPHDVMTINVPIQNIEVINLPEDYSSHIVYGEETIQFEISGLPDTLASIDPSLISGQIDALTLISHSVENNETENTDETENTVTEGQNTGTIKLILPDGVVQNGDRVIEVVINHQTDTEE